MADTRSRILNRLAYDVLNKASANSTVATGDRVLIADVSETDDEIKYSTPNQVGLAAAGGTAGTVAASSVLYVGANKNLDTLVIADGGLKLGSGAGTAINATAAEINNVADTSARMVAAGGTLAMVQATHDGRIIALDTAAGSVVTLPASTGGGAVYKFLVTVTATSNSHVIKVANASDEMRGYVVQDSDTATAPNIWWAADNDDTITLNRTTTGLAAQGEYFEIVDAVLNHFFVRGYSQASGIEATPFSATV